VTSSRLIALLTQGFDLATPRLRVVLYQLD
jgi:hypothetical protein